MADDEFVTPGVLNYRRYLNDPERQFPAWISPAGEWLVCSTGKLKYDLHEHYAVELTGRKIETLPNGKINGELSKKNLDTKLAALKELFTKGYVRIGFNHQNPETEEVIMSRGKKQLNKAQMETLKQHHFSVPSSEEWEETRDFDKKYGSDKVMKYYVRLKTLKDNYPAEYRWGMEKEK